jgi:protein-S-isoprenylcysteine O-methyltransferase Ste14
MKNAVSTFKFRSSRRDIQTSMERVRWVLPTLVMATAIGAILFGTAGRLNLPFFWLYLLVWATGGLIAVMVLDPSLYRERMSPGGKSIGFGYWLLTVPLIAHWAIAGMDVGREHWSDTLPRWLQSIGLAGFALGFGLIVWAMAVNRFFSSVVRIQSDRGHELVTSGPYGWIRHPGYLAALLQAIFSGMALGSWVSMIPVLLMLPLLFVRTAREDRFLRGNLPGYLQYAHRVQYRLVPGIW